MVVVAVVIVVCDPMDIFMFNIPNSIFHQFRRKCTYVVIFKYLYRQFKLWENKHLFTMPPQQNQSNSNQQRPRIISVACLLIRFSFLSCRCFIFAFLVGFSWENIEMDGSRHIEVEGGGERERERVRENRIPHKHIQTRVAMDYNIKHYIHPFITIFNW